LPIHRRPILRTVRAIGRSRSAGYGRPLDPNRDCGEAAQLLFQRCSSSTVCRAASGSAAAAERRVPRPNRYGRAGGTTARGGVANNREPGPCPKIDEPYLQRCGGGY
jgi:hypothetical protein